MTDDEREAREWLENATNDLRVQGNWRLPRYTMSDDGKHRTTILALLDAPRLPRPEDVPPKVICAMCVAYTDSAVASLSGMRRALQALYDHYTAPPKPKKVEAWAVVWPHYTAAFTDRKDAEVCAANGPQGAPCRVVKLVEAADE